MEDGKETPDNSGFKTLMDAIPEENRHGSFHEKYTDFTTMYNSFASADKMIGKDKVVIPGNLGNEQEFMDAHKKLSGLKGVEDYDFAAPKGMAEAKEKAVKQLMFDTSLSKVQAGKFINGLVELEASNVKDGEKTEKDRVIDMESKTLDMFQGRQEEASLNVKRALAKLGAGYSESVDVREPQNQKLLDLYGATLGNANVDPSGDEGASNMKTIESEQAEILDKIGSGTLSPEKAAELEHRYQKNQSRLYSLKKK